MWTPAPRRHHCRAGLRHQTDLTDAEWAVIAPAGRSSGPRRRHPRAQALAPRVPLRRKRLRRQRMCRRQARGRDRHRHRDRDRPQAARPGRLRRASQTRGRRTRLRLDQPQLKALQGPAGNTRLRPRLPLLRLRHDPRQAIGKGMKPSWTGSQDPNALNRHHGLGFRKSLCKTARQRAKRGQRGVQRSRSTLSRRSFKHPDERARAEPIVAEPKRHLLVAGRLGRVDISLSGPPLPILRLSDNRI